MRFEIAVDDGSLELASTGGNVAGQVHVVLDGEPFPDPAWWDFPCVVLGWWVKAAEDGRQAAFDLRFMDGPVLVRCVVDADNLVMTPIVESGGHGEALATTNVLATAVRAEIYRAARQLAAACQRKSLPAQGLELLPPPAR